MTNARRYRAVYSWLILMLPHAVASELALYLLNFKRTNFKHIKP